MHAHDHIHTHRRTHVVRIQNRKCDFMKPTCPPSFSHPTLSCYSLLFYLPLSVFRVSVYSNTNGNTHRTKIRHTYLLHTFTGPQRHPSHPHCASLSAIPPELSFLQKFKAMYPFDIFGPHKHFHQHSQFTNNNVQCRFMILRSCQGYSLTFSAFYAAPSRLTLPSLTLSNMTS